MNGGGLVKACGTHNTHTRQARSKKCSPNSRTRLAEGTLGACAQDGRQRPRHKVHRSIGIGIQLIDRDLLSSKCNEGRSMHGVEWLVDGWGGRLGSLFSPPLSRLFAPQLPHNAHMP